MATAMATRGQQIMESTLITITSSDATEDNDNVDNIDNNDDVTEDNEDAYNNSALDLECPNCKVRKISFLKFSEYCQNFK